MNFDDHREAARKEFHDHCTSCEHAGTYDEQEVMWMMESIEEAEQIKEVDGMIKIKWEHRCWWADCVWHLYYCRLARDVQWVEPYDMAKQSSLDEYTRKS